MIKGIVAPDGEPYDWISCIKMRHANTKDVMCPVDNHYSSMSNGIISVTSLKSSWKRAGCEMKLWFDFNIPFYIRPLDIYNATRGTLFHEVIMKNLDLKEYGVMKTFMIDGKRRILSGRIDGILIEESNGVWQNILVDIKTTGTPLSYLPKKDHILQLMLYDYLLEHTGINIDGYELDYFQWDKWKPIRIEADYRLEDDTVREMVGRAYEVIETDIPVEETINAVGQITPPKGFNIPDREYWVEKRGYVDQWMCCYCPFWPICKHGGDFLNQIPTKSGETKAKDPYSKFTQSRYTGAKFIHRPVVYEINGNLYRPPPVETILQFKPAYFEETDRMEEELFKYGRISDYITEDQFKAFERVL